MKVEFYNSKQRKELLERLNKQFGITSLPSILFETGKERIRGFSGDSTIDELYSLADISNVLSTVSLQPCRNSIGVLPVRGVCLFAKIL